MKLEREGTSVATDSKTAARDCAKAMLAIVDDALRTKGQACIAVSGGNTPAPMFDELAASGFDWSHVHLFWVDERAVPPTSGDSNYRVVNEHFLEPGHFPKKNVHRVHGEIDPDQAARRYRADIEDFFDLRSGQFPVFDAIHCGMGEDGHTASLFPGDAHIEDRNGLTAAVFAPKLPHWRITLLPGVLLAARNALILVAGPDKASVLKNVLDGEYDPWKYPVQLLAKEGANVRWFLDESAASAL